MNSVSGMLPRRSSYTVLKGLEHKYPDTGLLLVNNVCGAYCRFCFRKRLFTEDNDEVTHDISEAVEYIRRHPEINNILLTGGDPLIMSTGKLEAIIRQIRAIDHVRIIRIGSKMPAFDPYRIVRDASLLEMLGRYSTRDKKIYVMAHFNHPRELTDIAIEALVMLQKAGVAIVNQSPMIRGVNDDPAVIADCSIVCRTTACRPITSSCAGPRRATGHTSCPWKDRSRSLNRRG